MHNANRSTISKSSSLGNKAQINVYPGKNRINGNPSMMRTDESGKNAITTISKTDRIFTKTMSLAILTLIVCVVDVFIVITLISPYIFPV